MTGTSDDGSAGGKGSGHNRGDLGRVSGGTGGSGAEARRSGGETVGGGRTGQPGRGASGDREREREPGKSSVGRSYKVPPSDPQLLVAAARAVLATFDEALDKHRIPGPAAAALRLLEAALEPYP